MFTIEKIQVAEAKIKSGADFPNFIQEIKRMGVMRYDVFVINGMSIYYGSSDQVAQSAPIHEDLLIEQVADVDGLKDALKIHQNGATDYLQTGCSGWGRKMDSGHRINDSNLFRHSRE